MSRPNSRPARLSWLKSPISARPAPGYWILTATLRPSCQMASCTWPMDAAAAGMSLNSVKFFRSEVADQRPARARVLDLDRDLAAVVPDGLVHLADGRGRGRDVVELGEVLPI